MRNLFRCLVLVAATMVATLGPMRAQESADSDVRVALSGYDPVSYFTDGEPQQGLEQFSAAFDDAVYWFTGEEHQALFLSDPDAYAPQYNGYCAMSVSRGAIAEPDPHAWAISEGRLYVFHSQRGVNIFHEQTASFLEQAEENWPRLQAGL